MVHQSSLRSLGVEPDDNDISGSTAEESRWPGRSADLGGEATAGSRTGAVELQSRLTEAFQPAMPAPDSAPRPATDFDLTEAEIVAARPAVPVAARKKWLNRAAKSLIGLALLVAAVWIPAQQLFQVSSAEAVVNARLVTLRSPITGEIHAAGSLRQGEGQGQTLFQVVNPRADAAGVFAAVRAVAESRDEHTQITAQLAQLRMQQSELETQLGEFRAARIDLLETLLLETDDLLAMRGRSRAELEIELAALRRGVFIGDAYNDRPASAQRLDVIAVEIASLEARLTLNESRHPRLVEAEVRERAWYEQASRAAIISPASGIVWELLTAPGEQVVAGQELVRVVDCSQAVVTAAVSENVYNQLAPGMAAMFTFRDGGDPLPGRVVQLTGIASASANLAITPSALRAEPYRVVVNVPGLMTGTGNDCSLGRTGRVVFDTAGTVAR